MGFSDRAIVITDTFVAAECVVGERYTTKASLLRGRYLDWTLSIGTEPLSQRYFSQAIKAKGFATKRTRHGIEYLGLGLHGTTELKPKRKRPTPAYVTSMLRRDISVKLPRFIERQCETGQHLSIQSTDLYALYKAWVVTDRYPGWEGKLATNPGLLDHENLNIRTFVGMMRELGFPVKRTRQDGVLRSLMMGICLRSEPESAILAP